MLEAPSIDVNQTNELGQVTVEKGVTESDGSANRVSSLTGKKRRLVDSTPALENESTGKIARKPRAGKSMDYIPDDDDLLASILGEVFQPQFFFFFFTLIDFLSSIKMFSSVITYVRMHGT